MYIYSIQFMDTKLLNFIKTSNRVSVFILHSHEYLYFVCLTFDKKNFIIQNNLNTSLRVNILGLSKFDNPKLKLKCHWSYNPL